jgi:hypothetical protein
MDAGYRGRAAPCQRERSDRALDWVTAVETFHAATSPTAIDHCPSVSWPKPYRNSHVQAIGR